MTTCTCVHAPEQHGSQGCLVIGLMSGDCPCTWSAVTKYVVCIPLDQTLGFLTEAGEWTTKHPEAHLHATRDAADAVKLAHDAAYPEEHRERCSAWIEEVADETSWRAQEDTW